MKQKHDIHDRIYKFVLRVLFLIKKLPKTYENQVLIGQLIRSVTSIGANDQEADGTMTKADFIHCYTMVRKEGKESVFWLKLLADINSKFQDEISQIISEGNEIVSIITSIIFKTRNK